MRHHHLPTALLLAALLSTVSPGWSCLISPPRGAHVTVASESAIIVWNAKTHTEQFIRRADFASDARDFGFLVPTPTIPILSASNDGAFKVLNDTYHPKITYRERRRFVLVPLVTMLIGGSGSRPQARNVEVVNAQHVAGYDAVVLRADNAAALNGWLGQHGYQSNAASNAWLQPYVDRHWAITAFKIVKPDPNLPKTGLTPVRMSFQTDRPFYPYREGGDQRAAGGHEQKRLLRIYFIGDQRMEGALDGVATPWPGHALWAEPNPGIHTGEFDLALDQSSVEGKRSDLTGALDVGNTDIPPAPWLTVFEDTSSPRPGIADLYFSPSANQTKLDPPAVEVPWKYNYPVPVEFVVIPLFIAIKIFRNWRAYLGLDPEYTDVINRDVKNGCSHDVRNIFLFILTYILLIAFFLVVPVYI